MRQLARRSLHWFWHGVERSRTYRIARPWFGGVGTILMLHRVRPESERSRLQSNRTWEVTPDQLQAAIDYFKANNYVFLSLDAMKGRLLSPATDARRFVCFTLDDGYADNAQYALPVFQKNRVPFCIYIATCYPDGAARMWGLALEAILSKTSTISVQGKEWKLSTEEQKAKAHDEIRQTLESLGAERGEKVILDLGRERGIDLAQMRRKIAMDWQTLKEIVNDPLVTIGAHTVHHPMLAKLSREKALEELKDSKSRLERELSRPVNHFAFPYGHPESTGLREFELAKEAGFATAVTTNTSNVYPAHKDHLHALPRVNFDGRFESTRAVEALDKAVSGFHFLRARVFGRRILPPEVR